MTAPKSWLKIFPALLWLLALLLAGSIISQLPLATIADTIKALSSAQWLIWICVNLGIILVATQRWWVLAGMLKLPVRFSELLMLRQAGQTVSFMTPGPQFGGEPLQIFWLYKRSKLPIHSALLTVCLDRFYELWINFGVLLLTSTLLLISPVAEVAHGQKIVPTLLILLLTLSLLGWLLLKQPERILAWIKRVTRHWQHHPRLQNIETHWQRMSYDLHYVMTQQQPALLKAFLLSILGWLGLLGELWLLLTFLDLNVDLSTFLTILVAMRLAFLLPLPGGLGTLEASLFWVFQYLSLPTSAVLGLIALMRLRDVIILLVGLYFLRVLQFRE
jgi:uncharacterized protein (TIRG00374 family)